MYSLHTLLSEAGPSPHDMINEDENDNCKTLNEVESYGDEDDWIMDGNPPITPPSPSQNNRRRTYGDEKLDYSLSML
eukprot:2021739-Ditylum_brightwellii.AAC.1